MAKRKDMLRAAAQFSAYTVLIFAVILVPHIIAYALVPEPAPERTTISCPTEDSVNCFWDASEQGNGLGQDLWN